MLITRLYPLGTEVRFELTRFIRTRPLPAYLGEPLHYLTVGELMINHDNWEVDFSLLFAFSLMRHWSIVFHRGNFTLNWIYILHVHVVFLSLPSRHFNHM